MTEIHSKVSAITSRIIERSRPKRDDYLKRMQIAMEQGIKKTDLSCGNMAHACAAASAKEKRSYTSDKSYNIGIITAYNDMLSAHQPFEKFPQLIKEKALSLGSTAQVAGGVPAMCDGVTQGQNGMELSLFSRDVIALSASVALSHQCFDAAIYLGVCDKIIPGLVMAAASFGHLPTIMLPAGPMPSGLPNEKKVAIRQSYAEGKANRGQLLAAEMSSYHGPGTCTFYGTANTNQLLMEIMGLHLPGGSFVNPNTPLRDSLTQYGVEQVLKLVKGDHFTPACEILSEKNFVNALVGLLASGGSTNLVIHLIAMARSAGIIIKLEDFSELSSIVPLLVRVYPNGSEDINSFQNAGGMPVFISELLQAGLLHRDVKTVVGNQLDDYLQTPELDDQKKLVWDRKPLESSAYEILSPIKKPHAPTGGLVLLEGNIGRSIIKVSALKEEAKVVRAPCRIFHDQQSIKDAFEAGELNQDIVCVVRFQGPQANGMPELHGLSPILGAVQARGHNVALVTDGRMSGASGKIPAAIHVSPEASAGGMISRLKDGDIIYIDSVKGILRVEEEGLETREAASADLSNHHFGCGRELFSGFRQQVTSAEQGACVLFSEVTNVLNK